MTEDHYPEWAQTICSWKYLWVVELALLLAIIILIITACRFYFQMKEAERFLKEDEEAGSDGAKPSPEKQDRADKGGKRSRQKRETEKITAGNPEQRTITLTNILYEHEKIYTNATSVPHRNMGTERTDLCAMSASATRTDSLYTFRFVQGKDAFYVPCVKTAHSLDNSPTCCKATGKPSSTEASP